MAIPETQLETWSRQGAIAGSRDTYATIKKVLEGTSVPYRGRNYKVFLQGSYGNDTNIYAESDVDIVIRLDDSFLSDRTLLSPTDESAFGGAHSNASYSYSDFKADVLSVLRNAFPNAVTPGDKAFAIKSEGNRRKADVLPCVAFRRYYKFKSVADQSYSEGICFFDKGGIRISNYPKQHSENLTTKHQSTAQWLKPMIRVLKNLRSCLIDKGMLESGKAPSYYLEGLLYNVPADKFGGSYGDSFANAINWIQLEADKTKLVTANEQFYLLRDGVKTCWPKADAEAFLTAAIRLWKEW